MNGMKREPHSLNGMQSFVARVRVLCVQPVARNEEKAHGMLNKWTSMKEGKLGGKGEQKP